MGRPRVVVFQTLIGTVKSAHTLGGIEEVAVFQTLIGTVKSHQVEFVGPGLPD